MRDFTNEDRADAAQAAIVAHAARKGEPMEFIERSILLRDLLADLAHWAKREDVDFEAQYTGALSHFIEESE